MNFLGYYTASDLADLTKSYDYQESQLVAAFTQAQTDGTWASADSAGWTQYVADFNAWRAAYDPQRADATQYLSSVDFIATDEAYRDLGAAFAPAESLDLRLRQSPSAKDAPTYAQNPQPQTPDAQLGILTWAQKVTAPILDPVFGDTSLDPNKSQGPGGVPWPTYAKWGIIGGAVVAGVWVLSKVKEIVE